MFSRSKGNKLGIYNGQTRPIRHPNFNQSLKEIRENFFAKNFHKTKKSKSGKQSRKKEKKFCDSVIFEIKTKYFFPLTVQTVFDTQIPHSIPSLSTIFEKHLEKSPFSWLISEEVFYMIEIEMENKLGLKIYINGVSDIKEIPPEKLESILAVLEMPISKYYQKENSTYSDLKEEQA